MFWKRATGHGAFTGLVAGTTAAALHHGLTLPMGAVAGVKGGFLGAALHTYPSDMAQTFWTAIVAWTTCFTVTILVSFLGRSRPDTELVGLVWSVTPIPKGDAGAWFRRPAVVAGVILVLLLVLNLMFR